MVAPPPNPFNRKIDENSIFSFPACATNGNVNVMAATDDDAAIDASNADDCVLIQLDCDIDDEKYSRPSMTGRTTDGGSNAQPQLRNRSLSDTLAFDVDTCNATGDNNGATDTEEQLETNPFVAGNIPKTVSDTQLEKLATTRSRSGSQTWSFGRSLSRQGGTNAGGGYKTIVGGSDASTDAPDLKRAMSCDSVNSESSVILADLEQQIVPAVTGLLCVGLQYDK